MPKLKKKSVNQRRKQSHSCIKRQREDDSQKSKIQEIDRKSKRIRRKDQDVRERDNILNKIFQKKRLVDGKNKELHHLRLKVSQDKRLSNEKGREIHKQRLKVCQKKRLMIEENKEIHRLRESACQRKRLSSIQNRAIHRSKDKESHKKWLANVQNREIHRKRLKECQTKRISNVKNRHIHLLRVKASWKKHQITEENFALLRKIHRLRLRECQRKRLAVKENRNIHRLRLQESQKKRLSVEENRNIHRLRLQESQKKRLSVEQNRNIHRLRLQEAQRKRLAVEENRNIHRLRLQEAQRKRLAVEENRNIHRTRLQESQRKRLAVEENRNVHRLRQQASQRKYLSIEANRSFHLERLRKNQNKRFKHNFYLNKHKSLNKAAQKKRLADKAEHRKHTERQKKSQYKRLRIQEYRYKHNRRNLEAYHRRVRSSCSTLTRKVFDNYNASIKDGPYWECVSCCRLFFKTSVTFCTRVMLNNTHDELLRECCVKMMNDLEIGYLCSACKKSLKQNEKPRFSLCHKELRFPVIPEEVRKLSPLEERFLCPRIPFMQIRTFGGSHQQYSVKGRVVNVPTDVSENIAVLPRVPHETDVIPVVLKKRQGYKSNIMFQTVRPNAIIDALKILEHCPVYKKADVKINYNNISELRELQQTEVEEQENLNCNQGDSNYENGDSDSDSDCEPLNVPAEHTLLNSEALVFAPGENFQPIPLFLDTDAEAMSFIRIYGGEIKEYPDHMSYQEITKSEVMRSDRRVASSIDKLFFSCTYLRAQKVSNSISICMRKSTGRGNVTVGAVLVDDFVKSITVHDSGYKVFAPDRGSPAFWEQKKKDLFAMIRQLGPPTFFITLSPAETKWGELLVILKRVLDDEEISEDEALNMAYSEKVRLIKDDPVTCALYFDYRLRRIFSVMKEKNCVFREYLLVDSYIRVEFQQRGSPHAHCLIWLNGAPKLNLNDQESIKQCEMFVNRFISCSKASNEINNDLIQFQVHKHTHTCWKKHKKNEKKCRFGIPSLPMIETKILEPLDDSVNEMQLKKIKDDFRKIRALLDVMYSAEQDLTYDEFLLQLDLSNEDYIMAIRSSLKRPQCFLKRSLREIRINAYNPEILSLHRSNMDIQFITDVYSCAMYVLNYINKSKGGVSKILRDATKEVKKGDFTLKEKLRFLANKFLNASEFCAQEAVYYLLSMPLSMCSRSTIFINTSPPEKRVSILKTKKELLLLPSNSTDIYKKSLIDQYSERPKDLERVCLASFAAFYSRLSPKARSNIPTDELHYDDSTETEARDMEQTVTEAMYKKRKRAKIIRYVRYNVENDEDNYYREQIMLFLPWRNEREDILNVNHKVVFANSKDIILANRAKFIYGDSGDDIETDLIDEAINNHNTESSDDEGNDINECANEFEVLNDRTNEADIFTDAGIDVNKKTENEVYFPVPNLVDDLSYKNMVCSLNKQQRKYMLHVLNSHKLKHLPTFECVLGGAGVGKSRLIETIHQTLLRYYNIQEGADLESLKVLICAPTGKAAFNIKGVTLHSAFVLPVNQFGGDMPPLSSSVSNSILSKLHDLKLIIIDEVSMVGSKTFGRINLRLQQIFRSSEPFAGKSIIMFGDFNQLAPVGDKYIFKPDPSNPYSDLIGNPLWEKFTFFTLTQIMRQKDDEKFAIALNNLAEGNLSEDEVNMFNSRVNCLEPPETIRLYRSNAEVDNYNESVFKKQPDVSIIDAVDKVIGKVQDSVKKSLLKAVKELKASSTYGLPKRLKLSIGIHYMVTNNIKVEDGLVNGAVGILKHIERNDVGDVKRLWLLFSDPLVGKKTRNEVKNVYTAKAIDNSLTPIEMVSKNIKPRQNTLAMVMRKQFPVVPAEAITIHKSQGGTYSSAVVNVRPGMKRNELYVAFSRVTSLNGLFIRGKFVKPQKTNDEVSRVIKSAMKEKPLLTKLIFLDNELMDFTIVFHNIQSLRKHHDDLVSDQFLTCASIIALVETWTINTDCVDINNYKEVYRINVQKKHRHAYGILIYCKVELADQVELLFDYNCEEKHSACNLVALKIEDITVCVTYKPPSTPFAKVRMYVDSMIDVALKNSGKVVVLGDFNIDLMTKSGKMFDSFLTSKSLNNKIVNQPSTNGMTQIDVCYSNVNKLSASYFESYFSYHKPIICVIKKNGHGIQDDELLPMNDVTHMACSPQEKIHVEIAQKKSSHKETTDETADRSYLGFQNLDGVSCYANVVCQCVLHIAPIHAAVLAEGHVATTNLMLSHFNRSQKYLSSWEVRKMVDTSNTIEQFSLLEQQDVPEFIDYFKNCFPLLDEISQHFLCYELKCTNCHQSFTDGNKTKNTILPIYTSYESSSLKVLFENSYGKWENVDRQCNQCGFTPMMSKCNVELEIACSVLIFQLMIFEHDGIEQVKKQKILQNLNTEVIEICNMMFRVSGIICHHGTNITSGHYTCKLRSDNLWINADDRYVVQCDEPKIVTDAYVIVLEKF